MKVRLFAAIVIFYIAGSILSPLLSGVSNYLIMNVKKSTIITKSSINSGRTIIYTSGTDLVKGNFSNYLKNIRSYFSSLNKRKCIELVITTLLLLSIAYLISAILSRQYMNLCRKMEDIKAGDYTVKLVNSGIFPEMANRLKELSSVLDKERQSREEAVCERTRSIIYTVDHLQKIIAGIKGNVNVVIDTGVLAKGSQESIILENISESIKEMERIIDPLKKM